MERFIPKEISWLDFNECVLQEAENPDVPLVQRLRYLGIYSSNLDEFFRVRVATLKQLTRLGQKAMDIIGYDPKKTIKAIEERIIIQNERFNLSYERIIEELEKENIFMLNEKEVSPEQIEYIKDYFRRKVHRKLVPIMIRKKNIIPGLKDRSIYFIVTMKKKEETEKYALIEIPAGLLPRFVILPESDGKKYIILLDDIIRLNLPEVFSMFDFEEYAAYTIKLTRDAEIDIDNDYSESMIKKISRSLKKREIGRPVRFIYDSGIPEDLLNLLLYWFNLKHDEAIIPGGRYHNFRDFMDFPNLGLPHLEYPRLPAIPHRDLVGQKQIFKVLKVKDVLLNFPYHSFDSVIDLLREASMDPKVTAIKITIYRAAKNSSVLNALMNAVKNGKSVTVIVELQARFDEEANINWARKLRDEGVYVAYGLPGLKVHSKLCLFVRKEGGKLKNYAIVSTGNFNEDTARVYTDYALLTSDSRITDDVRQLFEFFESMYNYKNPQHLIVSPFSTRNFMTKMIRHEINQAVKGKKAMIILKLNNLVDEEIIESLYEAAAKGVTIRLIVRGMFSLLPELSGNMEAVRIVDRFLEHSRVFYFYSSGDEKIFISSADVMTRNLDKRIETVCPVYNPAIKQEIKEILDIQLKDNVKARDLLRKQQLKSREEGQPVIRSQIDIFRYLVKMNGLLEKQ